VRPYQLDSETTIPFWRIRVLRQAPRALRIRTCGGTDTSAAATQSGVGGSIVRVVVTDSGIGIPEKYLDKVFEPYFTHGKPDGTGLGLALAKKIVEDHKGSMEIRSTEGTGTTVAIILPAERKTNA